ncbi:hypothetical protein FRC03_010168 [Tulasnella sp. 419]|nr:hypothetical protein FRC03_010168 [Tulasnella sp. 419]
MKTVSTIAPILALALPAVQALVPIYGQCGGQDFTGETQCESGLACVIQNTFYFQCLTPAAGQTTTGSGGSGSTPTSSTKSSSTTKASSSTSKAASSSSSKTTTTSTKTTTSSGGGSTQAPVGLIGYATLNGGTTGGAGGTVTTVSSLSALRAAVSGTAAKIVRINTIIQGDADEVDIGSNTSILGGCGGGLTGGGFRVKNGKNVIFRNLKLYKSEAPIDLIAVEGSTNIWVDHNEFFSDKTTDKDFYDGALDIKHGSDYVTVSYNYFHDHWKTSLVGHSDNNESEDKGKFHVTYHHNWYYNVGSRLPSLRFGTGHIFNNYAEKVAESGVNSRLGAQVLVENNVFVDVNSPLLTLEYGGFAVERGNDWGSGTPELNPGTLNTVPYAYSLDGTSSVKSIVQAQAGSKLK